MEGRFSGRACGFHRFHGTEGYRDREFGMLDNDDNFFARLKYNF